VCMCNGRNGLHKLSSSTTSTSAPIRKPSSKIIMRKMANDGHRRRSLSRSAFASRHGRKKRCCVAAYAHATSKPVCVCVCCVTDNANSHAGGSIFLLARFGHRLNFVLFWLADL
jgi:hypothetical protein